MSKSMKINKSCQPYFSVIIPTYNCEVELESSLLSLEAQTYVNYECIIVDGKSTDNTNLIIKRWEKEKNINLRYISERDGGIYDAMNKGVHLANGEMVIFLGAGDTLKDKDVLRSVYGEKKAADVLYGFVSIKNSHEIIKRKMNFFTSFVYRPICHQAIFARRELLKQYPFRTQYKYVADQAWIMEVYSKGAQFKYIDLDIAEYNYDGFSSTEEARKISQIEILDAKKKFFPFQSKIIAVIRKARGV